MNRKLK
jgi:hypothetical protein